MSDLPLSFSQPRSLSLYFASPVQLREESDRMALLGIWHPARVSPALMLYDILVGFGGKKKRGGTYNTNIFTENILNFLLKDFFS